jgi:stearoyl-CoA desaturase (Delta-9 desaturase)
MNQASKRQIDWVNTIFLIGTPLAAAVATPLHIIFAGIQTKVLVFFFVYSMMTSMSITGGYHRLFAHKSYEARWWVKLFYLIFGAAAFQNSALRWCSDHRRHHRHVDTDVDPYSIKKGFFYAHIGWIFFKHDPQFDGKFAPDLERDPLIQWQHKYYFLIAGFFGFGFPTLIGWALGSPLGGLIYGGLLRVVFTHHCTFLINSFCHMIGRQPYSDKNTARDSFLMALFTYGEGYHNYHHQFQADYRNGVRWYHWDPTKWSIILMSWLGWAEKLKKVSSEEILRARLSMEFQRLTAQFPSTAEMAEGMRSRVEAASQRMAKMRAEYLRAKKEFTDASRERILQMKADLRDAKLEFKAAYGQWRAYNKAYARVKIN